MKRLSIAGLGLALCACAAPIASTPPPIPDAVAGPGTVILTGERAFAVAELAYTTAADGVGRLVDAGVIRGATAARVRGWNARARALLVTGKATADTARKAEAATELFGLADSLDALIGSR